MGRRQEWQDLSGEQRLKKWKEWRDAQTQNQRTEPKQQEDVGDKALKADDKDGSGSEGSEIGKTDKQMENLGNGVVLLEDDSPYIVYGGEKWSRDHKGQCLSFMS